MTIAVGENVEMDRQTAADLLDNLIGMVEDAQENDYDTALRMGIEALKADVQPVQRGHWIGYAGTIGNECSICHTWLDVMQGTAEMNFCPNCGARMEGDTDG